MVPNTAQVLLRARLALHAKASKAAEAIVLVTDADGLTLWVNGTFEAVMGYALEDIAGRMPELVLEGPETDGEAVAAIGRALRARQAIETRMLAYKKNRAAILLDLEILPILDEAAGLNGFVYLGQPADGQGLSESGSPQPRQLRRSQAMACGRSPDGASNGAGSLAETLLSAYPYKVLVAEDHPINLKLVVALLQAAGCEARCAVNGAEALAELETADFDLVVMDSQMPVMTGIEAIAIIRMRDDWKRCIPILSLTAHAMKGAEEYHTTAGADLYMSKPLRSDCFIGAVRSLAQRGRDLREKEGGEPGGGTSPAR
ncbi:MAG: response regulator [Rhodomicrobium sp.]